MTTLHSLLCLLQGDVGSGKAIVALLAMPSTVGSGTQAAFVTPTEPLARPHHTAPAPLCPTVRLQLDSLMGSFRPVADAKRLNALEQGATNILIGTHALFQERMGFHDLGLAVVDEQHCFGVHQKPQLTGIASTEMDTLVMAATPIPCTLTIIVYGYINVSGLDELTTGRLRIATRVRPFTRLEVLAGRLRNAIDFGATAYWFCPLVDEEEVEAEGNGYRRGLKRGAARERYTWLQ